MIYIEANTVNIIYLTLSEDVVNNANHLLVRLRQDISTFNQIHFLLGNDLSSISNRINKYEVEEGDFADYSFTQVRIPQDGMYLYEIFELDIPKEQELNNEIIENIDEHLVRKIEIGRMKVIGNNNNVDVNDIYK